MRFLVNAVLSKLMVLTELSLNICLLYADYIVEKRAKLPSMSYIGQLVRVTRAMKPTSPLH